MARAGGCRRAIIVKFNDYKRSNSTLSFMWKKIRKEANFDITEADVPKMIKKHKNRPDIFFLHGKDDDLIKFKHS